MHIIDSHFHWWPRSIFERLCRRTGYPHAEADGKGGYIYHRQEKASDYVMNVWPAWFDLDEQLAHMEGLGHQVDAVCSIGPFSVCFSELPLDEGKDYAIQDGDVALADRGVRSGFGNRRIGYHDLDLVCADAVRNRRATDVKGVFRGVGREHRNHGIR